jgi:hypothetical protein
LWQIAVTFIKNSHRCSHLQGQSANPSNRIVIMAERWRGAPHDQLDKVHSASQSGLVSGGRYQAVAVVDVELMDFWQRLWGFIEAC